MNIEEFKADREKLVKQLQEVTWQIQGAIAYVDMKIKEEEAKLKELEKKEELKTEG